MITKAANFLKDELSRYLLRAGVVLQKDDVFFGKISTFRTLSSQNGKVVISLVNIEEESTPKNVKNQIHNIVKSEAPPLHLNLYFLFTATLPTGEEKINKSYQDALTRISTIMEFFQSKPILKLQNPAGFSPTNLVESGITEMLLRSELYILNLEQINHLWGSLSGNQPPFVLYRVKCEKINS